MNTVREKLSHMVMKRGSKKMSKRFTPYMLILPAVLGMLFVHFIPMLWGFIISFMDLNIYTVMDWIKAPFIGLSNYVEGFSSVTTLGQRFFRSIFNVAYYSAFTITLGYLIGLGAALLLNKKFVGRTLVRGLILLPYITPDSVAYNLWRFIFQARIGILNKVLLDVGLISDQVIWLVGNKTIYAVIVASVWKGWPFTALILLAGLQSIDPELYQAAKIDGANAWQRFKYITLPHLRPVTRTLIVLNILWNFNAYNQFAVMLGTDPGKYAEVPSTLIMRQAFHHLEYGIGAALSIVLMLIMLLITIGYFYYFRIRAERKGE